MGRWYSIPFYQFYLVYFFHTLISLETNVLYHSWYLIIDSVFPWWYMLDLVKTVVSKSKSFGVRTDLNSGFGSYFFYNPADILNVNRERGVNRKEEGEKVRERGSEERDGEESLGRTWNCL